MKFISLLLGINVGGHNKIKMADLKALFNKMGFNNVVTYIQSGNVIFDTDECTPVSLESDIKEEIAANFNIRVPVIIRSVEELGKIIQNCPWGPVSNENRTKILVSFLSSRPDGRKINKLISSVKALEKLEVIGKEGYLYCPNGCGRSKLTNTVLEKDLEVVVTTRNWNTIIKLYELSLH